MAVDITLDDILKEEKSLEAKNNRKNCKKPQCNQTLIAYFSSTGGMRLTAFRRYDAPV